MKRRTFIKNSTLSMAMLPLGGIISLSPNTEASADKTILKQTQKTLADSIHTIKKVPSVCLNCSTVCGINILVNDN